MRIEDIVKFFWNNGDSTIKSRGRALITNHREEMDKKQHNIELLESKLSVQELNAPASKPEELVEVGTGVPEVNRIPVDEDELDAIIEEELSTMILPMTCYHLGEVEFFNYMDDTDVVSGYITALEIKILTMLSEEDVASMGFETKDEVFNHMRAQFPTFDIDCKNPSVTMIKFRLL